MRDVPWWGVVSSAAGPVLLVGGWTVAASLQPQYDPVADTVSALAAPGATDRWVMTLTFLLVGSCYIVTALALRPARSHGTADPIVGAVGGMLAAANPEHAGQRPIRCRTLSRRRSGSPGWPPGRPGARRRGPAVPWGAPARHGRGGRRVAFRPRRVVRRRADLGTGQAGLAERAAGATQAIWPLTVVLSCLAASRRRPVPVPEEAVRAG